MFEQQFPHLLALLRLRGLTVRNRIMSAPNMLFQTIGGRTPGKLLGAVHGGYFAAMDAGRF